MVPELQFGNRGDVAPQGVRDGPVFVAGCGRSGTTLVRTWLNSHPEIFVPTESLFLKDYVAGTTCLPQAVAEFLFYREPQLRCWYTGPRFRLRPIGEGINRIHEHQAGLEGARVWGQKTPRFVRCMPEFDAVLPGLRWVLVHRDPRAVVASMRRSRRHTSSLYRSVRRWKRDNQPVVDVIANGAEPTGRILVVGYERLVGDPENEWRRICDFVGVKRISLSTVAGQARIERFTRSRFDNNAVRDGVAPTAARRERWRETLTAEEIAFVETACRPEMKALGYEPIREVSQSRVPRPVQEVVRQVGDVRIVGQYLRHWPEYLVWTVLRKVSFGVGRLFYAVRGR